MREIIIPDSNSSTFIWQEKAGGIPGLWPRRHVVFITDKHVRNIHPGLFDVHPTQVLEPGEKNKTLETIHGLYQKFMQLEVDRSWHIVGIGGGVICDLTGFAAATFLRGIPFSFVPTTLLAQADASIGGKNGCNLSRYKNLVGTFASPEKVVLNCKLLTTLPQTEILNGITEIVKHGLIYDKVFFSFLEKEGKQLIQLKKHVLRRAVTKSITIKTDIVRKDLKDQGKRHILNFGHTLGHALESCGSLSHGESVALGMSFACFISKSLKRLTLADYQRILRLMIHLGLPVHCAFDPDQVMDAVIHDKKRRRGHIRFIGLSGIGRPEIFSMPVSRIRNFIEKFVRSSDFPKGAGYHG